MHGFTFPRSERNYWRETPNTYSTFLDCFTPQMYTMCMGTGILAVLMRVNPYQFRGLGIIAIIIWILDLLLFTTISLLLILRLYHAPKSTRRMFETQVEQSCYLSTTSIALATISELISLIPGAKWQNWQYVSFAFWWLCVGLSVGSAIMMYWLLIRDEEVHMENLSPTLLYPCTGLSATASAGSVLVEYTPLSGGLGLPVVMVSYILGGGGFFLALLSITAYFVRLLSNQTPPPKKVGAQLIPIGPLSNAAYAFVTLGYLAGPKRGILEEWGKGGLAEAGVGSGLYAAGFVLSIIIWGFATIWLLLCIVAFARDIPKTTFNLNMWSALYPFGAYGIAAEQISVDLDSSAFKVLTSMILVVLVIYWIYCVIWTLVQFVSGELFLAEALKEREEEERSV